MYSVFYSECGKGWIWRTGGGPQVHKKLWDVSAKLVGLENWDPFTAPDK